MNRFLQALANLFRIEELRKRVLFTLALLAVYRIGAHIPTPGINGAVLKRSKMPSAVPCAWEKTQCQFGREILLASPRELICRIS